MKSLIRTSTSGLLAITLCSFAPAIVWRNDISEQQVLNLGANSMFSGVGLLSVEDWTGTGTFIGYGHGYAWGITAKHVITTGQAGTFSFEDGRSYTIDQAYGLAGTDISLFRIAAFTASAFTPTLNLGSTFVTGTNLQSAGYGRHGAEGSDPTFTWDSDDKRRGMQSKINGTDVIMMEGERYQVILDQLDSPTSPNVRPLEGFGAPGDSGSALFTESGTILGVLSCGTEERYGAYNYYATLTPTMTDEIYRISGINAVPEPASFCVLGIGALAVMRRRRASK